MISWLGGKRRWQISKPVTFSHGSVRVYGPKLYAARSIEASTVVKVWKMRQCIWSFASTALCCFQDLWNWWVSKKFFFKKKDFIIVRRFSNLIAFWRTRTRYKQKRACIRTRTAGESPPWINCKPYSYNGEWSLFLFILFPTFQETKVPRRAYAY